LREILGDAGIGVSVQPVADHWYTSHTWWLSRDGRHQTMLEYLKALSHLVGYH
jgi:hypothetical protein